MSNIKISPERIDGVAKEFDQAHQTSDQLIGRLKTTIQSLTGEWEGATKTRFFQDFESAKNNMTQFLALLDNIKKDLTEISTKFRTTDGQ